MPAYREVLRKFEHQTGERVVLVAQQYPDIRRALAAEAAAGRGTLDIVELDVYSLAQASDDVDVLQPAEIDLDVSKFNRRALAAGEIDGLRFVPHRLAWQAMFYDHEQIGAPPKTWDELLAVAQRHPGKIGFKAALSEALTCDILPFVWAAGGSGESFEDGGARAAFELFAKLAPYLHPHSAVFKEATIAEAMARGELVIALNWPFAISLYEDQGLAPERIHVAPLPRAPGGGRATVLGGGYLAIPRATQRRDRALRLIRFLLSAEAQGELQRRLGWFSARRDIAISDDPLFAGFAALRDDVRSRPLRPDYPRLSRAWQQAFRAVAFDHRSPDEALAAAQK